jgi:hypothetical protein
LKEELGVFELGTVAGGAALICGGLDALACFAWARHCLPNFPVCWAHVVVGGGSSVMGVLPGGLVGTLGGAAGSLLGVLKCFLGGGVGSGAGGAVGKGTGSVVGVEEEEEEWWPG